MEQDAGVTPEAPPQSGGRKILPFLGIESLILLLIGFIVFSVLVILKAVPFSLPFFPATTREKGVLPKNPVSENNVGVNKTTFKDSNYVLLPTKDPGNVKNGVKVISDVSGYTLSITKENQLIDLLEEWGVYGRIYDFGEIGSSQRYPIYQVNIHFTGEPQDLDAVRVGGQTAFSSGLKLNRGTMDIYVQLAPTVISQQDSYIKDPGYYFTSQTLLTLFKIPHQTKSSEEQRALNLQAITAVNNAIGKYGNLIELKKI